MAEDYCAILAQLRQARIDLLTGKQRAQVAIANGMTVTYSSIDMAALDRAIAEYDGLCNAATGKPSRRYAMRGGAMK